MTMKTLAWGTTAADKALEPMTIERREPRPHDVLIEVLFCGVCHSDVHQARNEWNNGKYPMVPGHEMVGRVVRAGNAVTKFKAGDLAGVGCIVDSCRDCLQCREHQHQFCEKGPAITYNSFEMDKKTPTLGGYSTHIVVDENYVLRVPAGMDPAATAPLLCAGITTYSPLKAWGCKPGDHVGVVGLGGVGHMAVKMAASMGAKVTVLSSSESKAADARRLGATDFVVTNPAGLQSLAGKLDILLDTVSAPHDYNAYLALLRPRGVMVLLGLPEKPTPLNPFALVKGAKRLAGSYIGGIDENQEMLDHCAKHGIASDVEIIPIDKVNEAYERLMKGDVRYRFVIDLATLRNSVA